MEIGCQPLAVLPSLSVHPLLSFTHCKRHQQQISILQVPPNFWRLQPGFSFSGSGALLPSSILRVTAMNFLTRPQITPSHRELLVRWWHKGGDRDWALCPGWGHVLERAAIEPQTIFQLPDKLQGRMPKEKKLLTKTPDSPQPDTLAFQSLRAHLHSCLQFLLSPGPQVTDASSLSLKP